MLLTSLCLKDFCSLRQTKIFAISSSYWASYLIISDVYVSCFGHLLCQRNHLKERQAPVLVAWEGSDEVEEPYNAVEVRKGLGVAWLQPSLTSWHVPHSPELAWKDEQMDEQMDESYSPMQGTKAHFAGDSPLEDEAAAAAAAERANRRVHVQRPWL
mmetsp:Transcript_30563/g.52179  ORF Transcript_30563/g.52179 Transcript_30563/m.52179 type:complete len:157 (+) Transcript_30563:157-627(+)